jgi:hypothetical protein
LKDFLFSFSKKKNSNDKKDIKPTKITKLYKNYAKEYKYHDTFHDKLTVMLRNVNNV